MLEQFQNHINQNFNFLAGKKLLIAVSGGLDSMVLLHLFQQLNFEIAIAHCNFQLRGIESFEDQNFVQEYASANNIPIFVNQFDTINFAKDFKLSVQVAARNLRYDWFNEVLEEQNFDYILTAHQADDNLETFIINLSRGTGLEGLIGIPAINNKIIRPLLVFSRQEIEVYANSNKITWREDSSNASDKYLRNKIRHDIIPKLKELNPNLLNAFQKTQGYLQESVVMVDDAANMIYQQVATEIDDEIHFDLTKLKTLANFNSYLYLWLIDCGFTAWNDIYDLVNSQSGKTIYSNDYQLLKNRNQLILSSIVENNNEVYFIEKNQLEVKVPIKLTLDIVDAICESDSDTIFVDENLLKYPLIIRKWKSGDVFYPLGMNGGSKKVSKYFKDVRFSTIDKNKTWLLADNNKIIWIVNHRADERFKVTNTTKNILKITVSK